MDKKHAKKNAAESAEETAPVPEEETAAETGTEPPAESAKSAENPAESAETPAEEPAKETETEALRAQAEAFKTQAEEMKRKWYSVTAEYENYRRRTANESARRYLEGRADVVKGLFPIADNLDRALKSCSDEQTKRGIELVVKAFEKLLAEEKIVAIDPIGEPFDAEKHEAIMAVDPAEGEESGTVKQVYLKGYEQNGKVLRFAQVVVVK